MRHVVVAFCLLTTSGCRYLLGDKPSEATTTQTKQQPQRINLCYEVPYGANEDGSAIVIAGQPTRKPCNE